MKKKAGKEIQILSFNFTLTIRPKNISDDNPREEIIKTTGILRPIIRPEAPRNCKTIIASPNFSRLKRLNSLFI